MMSKALYARLLRRQAQSGMHLPPRNKGEVMRRTLTGRALAPVLLLAAAIPATSMAAITAMAAPGAAASTPHTPFGLSGLPAQSRGPKVAPGLARPGPPLAGADRATTRPRSRRHS